MKIAVVVGLFVLVACLQLQVNGADLAKCEAEIHGHTFICDDVTLSRPHCTGEWVISWLEEDLSKPFPECCGRWICRKA